MLLINLNFKFLGAIITIIKFLLKILALTRDKKLSKRETALCDNLFLVSLTLKRPEDAWAKVLIFGFINFKLKKMLLGFTLMCKSLEKDFFNFNIFFYCF